MRVKYNHIFFYILYFITLLHNSFVIYINKHIRIKLSKLSLNQTRLSFLFVNTVKPIIFSLSSTVNYLSLEASRSPEFTGSCSCPKPCKYQFIFVILYTTTIKCICWSNSSRYKQSIDSFMFVYFSNIVLLYIMECYMYITMKSLLLFVLVVK